MAGVNVGFIVMDHLNPSDRALNAPRLPRSLLEPPGFQWGMFVTDDGAKLRWGHLPTPGADKACLLVGGFTEFIEKYFETAQDLAARGFAVWCLDWLGQGGSDRPQIYPTRPRARDYDQDAANLAQFSATMLPREQPRLLVAHSMGGAIGLLSLRHHPHFVDAAVLSAPMLALPFGPFSRSVARALAYTGAVSGRGDSFVPGAGSWTPSPNLSPGHSRASHDPVRCLLQRRWFETHPHLRMDGPTFGWVHSAFGVTKRLKEPSLLREIHTPILLGSAGKEFYVDPRAHKVAAARLPNCRLVEFPDAKHELFCEADFIRNRWLAEIDRFVGEHLHGTQATAA